MCTAFFYYLHIICTFKSRKKINFNKKRTTKKNKKKNKIFNNKIQSLTDFRKTLPVRMRI